MSHVGHSRLYAEAPTGEWPLDFCTSIIQGEHLIDLTTGVSHGGFEALTGARQSSREKGLSAWDIFHGNVRMEYHDPR
jgi:hypothetical protein